MRGIVLLLLMAATAAAQSAPAAKKRFSVLCAACHGADGTGGERGPAIVGRSESRSHSLAELRDLIRNGIPAAGMPAFSLPAAQLDEIAAYVHALRSPASENPASGDAAKGEQYYFATHKNANSHIKREPNT